MKSASAFMDLHNLKNWSHESRYYFLLKEFASTLSVPIRINCVLVQRDIWTPEVII